MENQIDAKGTYKINPENQINLWNMIDSFKNNAED